MTPLCSALRCDGLVMETNSSGMLRKQLRPFILTCGESSLRRGALRCLSTFVFADTQKNTYIYIHKEHMTCCKLVKKYRHVKLDASCTCQAENIEYKTLLPTYSDKVTHMLYIHAWTSFELNHTFSCFTSASLKCISQYDEWISCLPVFVQADVTLCMLKITSTLCAQFSPLHYKLVYQSSVALRRSSLLGSAVPQHLNRQTELFDWTTLAEK